MVINFKTKKPIHDKPHSERLALHDLYILALNDLYILALNDLYILVLNDLYYSFK